MFKKTILALTLGVVSLPSFATVRYFLVVPSAHKAAQAPAGMTTPAPAPVTVTLYSTQLPDGLVGIPYQADLTHALQVTGDPSFTGAGVSWQIVSGVLPAGLSLLNGQLSGTPVAAENQAFTVEARYKDGAGQQQYQLVTLKLDVRLKASSFPSAVVGTAYSADLTPLLSVTGDPAYQGGGVTWRVVAGQLPAGLTLSNGVISGTPSASEVQNVTVEASYRTVTGQQTYQLVTLNVVVSLADSVLTPATVNKSFSLDFKPMLNVTGDSAYASDKVSWLLDSVAPAGLSLNSSGVLSGLPAAAGTYQVTVKAAYRGVSAQHTYSLPVVENTALISLTGLTSYYSLATGVAASSSVPLSAFGSPAFVPTSSPFDAASPAGALSLSGASGYRNTNTAAVSGAGDISFGMWVKTSTTVDGTLVNQRSGNYAGAGSNDGQFYFYMRAGKACYVDGYASGSTMGAIVCSTQSINTGAWNHVGFSRLSSGVLKIYVNGVPTTYSYHVTSISPNAGIAIGFDQRDNTLYFNGQMRDLWVFSREVTDAEFSKVYSARKPLQ